MGSAMPKHLYLSLLSLLAYSLCIIHASDLSVGKQRPAARCLFASMFDPGSSCSASWAGYKFKTQGGSQSETTSPQPAPFPCPTAMQTSHLKVRGDNLNSSLTKKKKESQVSGDGDCSSAALIYTAANSGHIWTQAERQVHELWTNTACQNTSIIISHGQGKHHRFLMLTFPQNLYKQSNESHGWLEKAMSGLCHLTLDFSLNAKCWKTLK